MDIQILGPGCKKCDALTEVTRQALTDLGSDAQIDKVTDPVAIATMGVMSTPGLVIDGKVVMVGQVPNVDKVKALITATK
jgi:small redox-active disulfide protein 2